MTKTTDTTGAVIREALTRHGVAHRVGEGATERGWLATTGHDGPTVYVTGHSTNGPMSYDTDREGFFGFNAVVTEAPGPDDEPGMRSVTRHVFAGTPLPGDAERDDPTPEESAEACARAVAAHFGIEPR